MITTQRAVALTAALTLGLLTACGSSTSSDGASDTTAAPEPTTATEQTAKPDPAAGQLFTITATGGSLADGKLELTGVAPTVTAFSDRPERSVDGEDIGAIAEDWSDLGFVEDPPNAALVTRGPAGQVTTVLELGEPVVDGDAVTFPAKKIEAGDTKGATSRLPSVDQPDDLVEPALFIDDGLPSPLLAISIDGTWGAGDTRVAFDGWGFSTIAGTAMDFQMGEPGTIRMAAYNGFLSLRTPEAITGTFSGIGVMDETQSLFGQAAVPEGSDLTMSLCGTGGPSEPLLQGDYDITLPDTCTTPSS